MQSLDPDLNAAIIASQRLERRELERHDFSLAAYQGSQFEWLVRLPGIKRRGTAMEKIIADVCARHFEVSLVNDSDADRCLGDVRFEFKSATLSVTRSCRRLTFNQIRPDQRYDYALFAGFLPTSLVAWCVPKAEVSRWCEQGRIRPQHGGRKSRETYCLIINVDDVPEWMDPWGGSFADAMSVAKSGCALTGQPRRRQLLLLDG